MDIRGAVNVNSLIGVLIVVVVACALVPTIATAASEAAACMTGAAATLVALVPLFYVVGIIVALAAWARAGLGKAA